LEGDSRYAESVLRLESVEPLCLPTESLAQPTLGPTPDPLP
jgi:hypothetical protein